MLEDIPYSTFTQDQRKYEIVMLRDHCGQKLSAIARKYGISPSRVKQLYNRAKCRQARLYIRHISVVLGHRSTEELDEVFNAAYKCYRGISYICAYLEKTYPDILEAYRAGEPGMPQSFLDNLPPLVEALSPETVSRIVEMREAEKTAFREIGEALHITPEKARWEYDHFYYQLTEEYVDAKIRAADDPSDKITILHQYFDTSRSGKRGYEKMMRERNSEALDLPEP